MRRSSPYSSNTCVKRTRIDAVAGLTSMPSLEQLPNEIMLGIFAFLDLGLLVNAFSSIFEHYNRLLLSLAHVNLEVMRDNHATIEKILPQYVDSVVRFVAVKVPNFNFTSMALANVRSPTIKYGNQAQYDSVRPRYFPLLEYLNVEHSTYLCPFERLNLHRNSSPTVRTTLFDSRKTA